MQCLRLWSWSSRPARLWSISTRWLMGSSSARMGGFRGFEWSGIKLSFAMENGGELREIVVGRIICEGVRGVSDRFVGFIIIWFKIMQSKKTPSVKYSGKDLAINNRSAITFYSVNQCTIWLLRLPSLSLSFTTMHWSLRVTTSISSHRPSWTLWSRWRLDAMLGSPWTNWYSIRRSTTTRT